LSPNSTFLYWLIVSCEIAFWLVLALALTARYLLKRVRVSRALLFALPAVDLALLAFTTADLRAGTVATFAHGLAAAYVGFTVAFGPLLVRWADRHFAYRFAGGPPPTGALLRGWAAVREELALWLRSMFAWAITIAFLVALIAYIGNEKATLELYEWFRIALGSIILWFVFGPVWRVIFFRREAVQ
jgi:hypothetical protein